MEQSTSATTELLGTSLSPGMMFGLFLLAAIVGGYAAHFIHFPRVVGFLLGGIALRAILPATLSTGNPEATVQLLQAAVEPLAEVKQLALGLFLFILGGVFERSRIRAVGVRVVKASCLEISLCALLVFAGCWLVAAVTQPGHGGSENFALALLLGIAAIATAPAATLLVLQEYQAKGKITETIFALTGVNNIVCIVLFYSAFTVLASTGIIEASGTLSSHIGLTLLVTIFGSVALGVIGGTLLSIVHSKLSIAETLLVFLALLLLLIACEALLREHNGLSFNFLLTAITIGAVFTNLAIDSSKLLETLRTIGAPLFACFFTMAGYGLHLGDFGHMGWMGGVYILCRVVGKTVGCRLGVRNVEGLSRAQGRLGGALLCQAAVVIALSSFVQDNWDSPLAKTFSTVILGSVVVFELIGPLLVKRCVVQGGEVKAITLLRRDRAAPEGASVTRITFQSLLRLFGWQPKPPTEEAKHMSVEHIMRTNVQLIPASATFDEVLHFIERSTHNHFPVVQEDGEFVGVIHFGDVREVIYDPTMSHLITAADLADAGATAVPMNMTLADLLDEFTRHKNIGVLPVIERADGKHIVGLVEQRDLLRAMRKTK